MHQLTRQTLPCRKPSRAVLAPTMAAMSLPTLGFSAMISRKAQDLL